MENINNFFSSLNFSDGVFILLIDVKKQSLMGILSRIFIISKFELGITLGPDLSKYALHDLKRKS